MTRCRFAIACGFFAITLLSPFAPEHVASQDVVGVRPPLAADVVPVLRYSGRAEITVPFQFANNTNGGFRYLKGPSSRKIHNLSFPISKDGRIIDAEYSEGPPVIEANIGTVPPRSRLRGEVDLRKEYVDLDAGAYEMRVSYMWPNNILTLSSVDIRKNFATIVIE